MRHRLEKSPCSWAMKEERAERPGNSLGAAVSSQFLCVYWELLALLLWKWVVSMRLCVPEVLGNPYFHGHKDPEEAMWALQVTVFAK